MRLLLDTTVLIDALRGRGDALDLIAEASLSKSRLMTSVVSLAEVYAGLRPGEETKAKKLFEVLDQLPVTGVIARRAGDLKRTWRKDGRTLALADMLIAATALEHGSTLATSNRKDFPMPELSLFPPR